MLSPAKVAVIVTDAEEVTFIWATVNVDLVFPECTTTVGGTEAAAEFELFRVTVKFPEGGSPLKVTVPVTAVAELP